MANRPGIVSYGAYLPYWRLQRRDIKATLGTGGGAGTRSVASYDEDTTSMAVEAGRLALAAAPDGYRPGLVGFATTAPAYADKTNATAIHAALDLPDDVGAFDAVGAVRSGVGVAWMAQAAGGLAVLADIRTGRPGSADEATGGDAAVALAFGVEDVVAEVVGAASVTAEFTDRWRTPGAPYSELWEERFGEHVEVPLVDQAMTAALKSSGLAVDDLDHVVLTGLHGRAVKAAARTLGTRPEALADDLLAEVGNTGTAHWALVLADVLDRADTRPADLRGLPGRWLRRVPAANDRRAGGAPAGDLRARPPRRHSRRPLIRPVPDVARVPPAGAAAAARARASRISAVGPHRRLEVRLHR